MVERIGFIGLSAMDKGMALNLQTKGFQLIAAAARESVCLARSTSFHNKDFSALLDHWCERAVVKAFRL
jgi:6-phosphogluconate dehydrogenase